MSAPARPKPRSDLSLARTRLDARLEPLRQQVAAAAVPRAGWLRAIRTALGMSLEDLSSRLGTNRSSVLRIESSEARGSIQLDTLRKAAAALDCELVYALIPRVPLQQAVEQRRLELAAQGAQRVRTHMALEGQEVREPDVETWRKARALQSVSDRALWKQPK